MSTSLFTWQFIDLGIHTVACMTIPGTCGTSGGAISVWYRVVYCNQLGSVVTTAQNLTSGGSIIYCTAGEVVLVAQKELIIKSLLLSSKLVILILLNVDLIMQRS